MTIVTTMPLARVCPGRLVPPATPAIFGAGEDLTKRAVGPALYHLIEAGSVADELAVVGIDHNDRTTEQCRQSPAMRMQAPAGIGAPAWSWRTGCIGCPCEDFSPPETFKGLNRLPAERQEHNNTDDVLFYLAAPDRFFGAVEQLGHLGPIQQTEQAWRRMKVGKPFGHDLASAAALNTQILRLLCEDQTDRIDHFLGKEVVHSLLVLRFAGGISEPLWNRDHVDPMQITVAKTVGVTGRGCFYEGAGARRDMVPFQFLAMIEMEPPTSFDADAVRACAAFHLRAGKCLSARATRIAGHFRRLPYALFGDTPAGQLPADVVTVRIQPDEELLVSFSARRGSQIESDGVALDFASRSYFEQLTTVGDETLICDCSIGDATLFQGADTVEAARRAVQGSFDCRSCDRACLVMTPRVGAPRPPTACSRAMGSRVALRAGHPQTAIRP